MKAEGYWTWWNHYGSVPIATCVQRASEEGIAGVIVKSGYTDARDAFVRAGVPWATERYVYPDAPESEAERLAADVATGARFAVINAEIEWERLPAEPMQRLIRRFRQLQPEAELYASVDTRGNRLGLPHQGVLAQHVAGWMPMIYPQEFYPHRPDGYVREAFQDSLGGKDFRGKPVLPTIQTYGGIGAPAVTQQVDEVKRRGLPGCQAYTVAHATDDEWRAFSAAIPKEDEMTPEERERLEGVENRTTFQQAVLEVFDKRIKFNDEMTRRLWERVFDEPLPEQDAGLAEKISEIERRIEELASATSDA